MLSAEIIRVQGWSSRQELVEVIITLTLFIAFSLLYIISYISYAFYICLTILSCTHCPRERVAVNMHGPVFALARLKIVPSYHQELVSHPMSEHVNKLHSLVRLKLQ